MGSITALDFQWPANTKKLGWPTIVRRFGRLRDFTYNTGKVTSTMEYFPTVSDLRLLPSSLERLYLRCDGAEAAFRNASPSLSFHKEEKSYTLYEAKGPVECGRELAQVAVSVSSSIQSIQAMVLAPHSVSQSITSHSQNTMHGHHN